MKTMSSKWNDESGGIDFIQVVVGLMIVAIASVGTFQALSYGNAKMNEQMRYRKAISIARSYVEYWQGRIHTDFNPNDDRVKQGNFNRPEKTDLDLGDPTTTADDITCNVSYGRLIPVDIQETGEGVDLWRINVKVTWYEPNQDHSSPEHEVTFNGSMVAAAL